MSSFLLLPMQRITRLPLLLDAILRRQEIWSDQGRAAQACYEQLKKVQGILHEASDSLTLAPPLTHALSGLIKPEAYYARRWHSHSSQSALSVTVSVVWDLNPWLPAYQSLILTTRLWLPCILIQVVKRCNEGAKKMDQTEQVLNIENKVIFTKCKVRPSDARA